MKINRENLLKVWKNKGQILEGVKNNIFKNDDVEQIAMERHAICATNLCGYYDADGSSEMAVVKGTPSCAGCGCSLDFKTRCLSCHCHLREEGRAPLWDQVVDYEEAVVIKEYLANEAQSHTDNA